MVIVIWSPPCEPAPVHELVLVQRPLICPDGHVRPLPGGSPVRGIVKAPDAFTRPSQPSHSVG